MGSFEVAGSDGGKAVLTSSIPNLQLRLFAVQSDCFDFEVDSNRGHKVVCELAVSKSE